MRAPSVHKSIVVGLCLLACGPGLAAAPPSSYPPGMLDEAPAAEDAPQWPHQQMSAPDAEPEPEQVAAPSTTVTTAGTVTVTGNEHYMTAIWQVPGFWQAAITLIGVPTALVALVLPYTLKRGEQRMSFDQRRDQADIQAIETREQSIEKLLGLLTNSITSRDELVANSAANQTRIQMLEEREQERERLALVREERERELIHTTAQMQVRLDELEKHLDGCTGGAPCPLAQLRRKKHDTQTPS